jgi:hypothetical protein
VKPQIPWLRVIVEGVVIVGSILLALAADAWWDGRNDREQGEALVASLASDYQENITRLDDVIGRQEQIVAAIRELVMIIDGDVQRPAADSVVRLINEASNRQRFERVRGGYEAILGAGDLTLISNRELLRELAAFAGLAEEEFEDTEESRLHVMVMHESLGPLGTGLLGSYGRDRLNLPDRPPVADSVWVVLGDGLFQASLSVRGLLELSRLMHFRELREAATRVAGLLAARNQPATP